MAKNRRSRNRRQTQCQQRAAAGQPRRAKVVVAPPQSPAKLRAKIRIRPASISSRPQATQAKPSEDAPENTPRNQQVGCGSISPAKQPGQDDAIPGSLHAPRQNHLPTRRANLGDRPPVFQPFPHQDAELTREDQPERPSQVTRTRGRPWVTGLTLALLATLVAGIAICPFILEHFLLDSSSLDVPQTEKAPEIPLEKQDRSLHAPSTDARRSLKE